MQIGGLGIKKDGPAGGGPSLFLRRKGQGKGYSAPKLILKILEQLG